MCQTRGLMRARGQLPLLLGVVILVAACSSTPSASSGPVVPSTTGASETDTSTLPASSVHPERFCEVVTTFDHSDNPFELPQEQARTAIPNKQALMVEAALVAPDEIRTEVQALVESFHPIFDLFEAADFEASRINEADFDALADAAFSGENSTRGKIMDDWVSINCDE
jgi:hypothetical protein